jgi:hypothetical protein
VAAGTDSYAAAIRADGPTGWYRFSELNAGQSVTAGGQDPQNLCLDSSTGGNLNQVASGINPFVNQNFLVYGSGVSANVPSLLKTRGGQSGGGSALFPSTATLSTANIATGGQGLDANTLQPTAAITVEAWVQPNVINGSTKQVAVCYGSDASSLAAYCLYHTGGSATTHAFNFSVNIAGTLRTATSTTPLLVAGQSYYAVGTYDGTNVRIYVNGVLQASTAITGAISYASIGGLGLAIGNDPSLTDANIQANIDEVGIYTRALTATQIAYHYRQGSTYLPFVWRH